MDDEYLGKFGVDAMALLDKANTETYGSPQPTNVSINIGKNPGILISGHDYSTQWDNPTQTF